MHTHTHTQIHTHTHHPHTHTHAQAHAYTHTLDDYQGICCRQAVSDALYVQIYYPSFQEPKFQASFSSTLPLSEYFEYIDQHVKVCVCVCVVGGSTR